jgi:tetratricopeptide (TPR) repeat protein
LNTSQLLNQASAANAAGRLQDARSLCEQILFIDPKNVQAILLLGILETRMGDFSSAVIHLKQVQSLDSGSVQAPLWLSSAHREMGMRNEALEAARRAASMTPDNPQTMAQLGLAYLELRALTEAEAAFRSAVRLAPSVPQIKVGLAQCLSLKGQFAESACFVEEAIGLLPNDPGILLGVGNQLLMQGLAHGAAKCARRALDVRSDFLPAIKLLTKALRELGDSEEAFQTLVGAIERTPLDSELHAILGSCRQSAGEIAEASASFEEALRLDPQQTARYFELVHSRKILPADRGLVEQMLAVAEATGLPQGQKSPLHYAIGKALDDLTEFEPAMEHYKIANQIEKRLKFKGAPFDRLRYAAANDRVMRVFSEESLKKNARHGSLDETPIFVVGMMRSGTTLVDQILSAHPDIGSVGEQSFWIDNWRETMDAEGQEIKPEALLAVASRYLQLVRRLAPGTSKIVDKMPNNRNGIGVLSAAFPNAKFIHVKRHPVDTALSIFFTPNRTKVEFAHDRANIVFGYEEYLRVMAHWRMILPPSKMLEIDYESLIDDTEAQTRRLVEFCGVEWSDACLRPQDNARTVVTPSVWQVRQPIYRNSVARWVRYEPWLGEFRQLLAGRDSVLDVASSTRSVGSSRSNI